MRFLKFYLVFNKKRFEIFLRCLLAMETYNLSNYEIIFKTLLSRGQISFGYFYPLENDIFFYFCS